jgi:hypothetical protein
MPYAYGNIQLDHVDVNNTTIQAIDSFTAATIPVLSDVFAIGNRIKLTLTIDASGPDSFTNKLLRFNPALFTNQADLNAWQFGYESNGVLTTTPTLCVLNAASATQQNYECYMSINLAATEATIDFYFYVTMDLQKFINNLSVPNINRLISAATSGVFTNGSTNTAYRVQRNLSCAAYVFDYVAFGQHVLEPIGSSRFLNIPVRARWFNSDYAGATTGMRYISEIEITSASQLAAGLPTLTDVTATGAQTTAGTDVRSIFTVTNNQLAVGEMNSVRVLLSGDAYTGSVGNDPVFKVRALLLRVDAVTQLNDFVTEYDLSDALVNQGAVIPAQLDNAIYAPSDWFEDVPNPDDVEVQFMIDGTKIQLNGSYYLIINIYDSINPEYVTTHISPELTASYVAPVLPTITGYLSTYNKEYSGNELTVAPHQRIKASIEVDKASYEAALLALGITADFDDCLFGVICKLTDVPGAVNQVQGYIPNTLTPPNSNQVLTADMSLITNDATTLRLEAIFRISEEYAGSTTDIVWTLSFNQPVTVGGSTQFNQITFTQVLNVSDFENDAVAPKLLAVRFYDLDLYLAGTKQEIIDICDADQIIAEVEKDPAFTGSINLVATIYPANESGETNPAAIEEEEDWMPTVIQMSQAVSGKLDNVDISFGGDDYAVFRINCQQLTQGQRYWVTAIAFEQFPDYCPLGLVQNIVITSVRPSAAPFWAVGAACANFVNEIIAHPDYVSGVTVVYNRVVDINGNVVGTNLYSTNVIPNDTLACSAIAPQATVYYEMRIDAVFDSGSGNHLISHTLRVPITLQAINTPPISWGSNAYECTDLG